jgi:hypothetical protein
MQTMPALLVTRTSTSEVTYGPTLPVYIRVICPIVALLMGGTAAWAGRSTMYPDGISYLDIGDAYWRGDWHNAVNAYWSPLYSWTVGGFLAIFKPSIRGEFPLVHFVNLLFYIVALAAFRYFLRVFIQEHETNRKDLESEATLPVWALYVAGYATFLTASLLLITISFVSADMLVAAIVYFVSALLLKIQCTGATWRLATLFGIALGIGYYAKTVMLPMALPFLLVAAVVQRKRGGSLKPILMSGLLVALMTAPFIIAISVSRNRPTFGDSGTFNYLVNVGSVQFFIPDEPEMSHPITKVPGYIEAYLYPSPISGTYPLWFDPSYWHENIRPHFNIGRQLRRLGISLLAYDWILLNPFLALQLTVGISFLYLISPKRSRFPLAMWVLWVPALVGLGMYSVLIVEPRYIAAQLCVLAILAFSGLGVSREATLRKLTGCTVLVVAFASCGLIIRDNWRTAHNINLDGRDIATPECATAAEGLRAFGVHTGDKIGVIAEWLFPSRQGSYIARLARARIVGEARPGSFWAANDSARARLMEAFAHAGAKGLLTRNPPRSSSGWQRLNGTSYYFYNIERHVMTAANSERD